MTEIPFTYWLKELWSNAYYLQNGTKAQFEPIGDDTGVMATNDANLIFQLTNASHKHVGGIVKISKEQYDELKKNSKPIDLEQLSKPKERKGIQGNHNYSVNPSNPFGSQPVVEAASPAAPSVNPAPAAPPPQKFVPRKGRIAK